MKLAVRGKLFATALVLVLVAVVPSALYLEDELRTEREARILRELTRSARLACVRLETLTSTVSTRSVSARARSLETIAAELSAAAREDITVLWPIESAFDDPRIEVTEHAMSVSVPFEIDGMHGAVRASRSLHELETAMSRQRMRFVGAALFGVLIAALMSALAAQQFSSALRDLVHRARGIARTRAGSTRSLLPEPGDELGGLAGSLNRISDALERTVTELGAERDRLRAVLEGVSEAVIAVDEGGRITLANRAASALLGKEGGLIGHTILELLRSPDLQELVDATRQEPTEEIEIELPGPPERRVVARATLEKFARECVIVLVDVTKMRRLETVRRDFVANVSHELRTPVSVVSANAETLLDGGLDDHVAARRFVDAIARNAARLSTLISDLLDLSRIEAGQYSIELEAIPIDRLAKRAAEPLFKLAEDKQIAIAINVPPELQVRGDERALEQVLSNLLENAVKYTEAGGHVEVRGVRFNDFVRIEVADDGPGIEPQHRSRIFERFYRVDPARSRQTGGTGLGLSIAKHLVDALGGEIGVEPREPRGSLFWVRLRAAAE